MKKQKVWGFVLPVALVAGILVGTPQVVAPTHADAAPATILSPFSPIKMERFYFYSSQSTKFVRPVVLQKKVGSSWKTIFSGKTAATGKFRFTVHTGSVDTLRAFSTSIRYGGKTYPQAATAPITVRPLTQTVSLTVAASTGGGTATAVTSPARNGRGVTLQRASANGSSWTTMATGKVNGQGRGTFRIPTSPAGDRYRIVMSGWNGAPELVSGPVASSAAASPEPTLSPAKPMKMEHFYFSSGVATQFVRPVVLQKKVGSSWKTIFSGKTAATGKFRFTVHTGSVDTLRALAAATTNQGTRYPESATTPMTVSPLDQKITLTMPKQASVNEAVTAQISADPTRVGRKVELQVQTGSGWTTLSSETLPASGPLTMKFTAEAQGNYRYQVVQEAWNGAPSAASESSAMTISPDEVQIDENARPLTAAESDAVSKYDPSSGTITLTNPPATMSTIKAGDVVAMPPRDDAPSGALVKVTEVSSAGGTTTLTTTPVSLPDVVTNVPDDATDIGMTVSSTSFTPADGVTVGTESTSPAAGQKLAPRVRGITPMAASRLKLNVDASASAKLDGLEAEVSNSGSIELAPAVDLSLNMKHGVLKGYRVGIGYDVIEDVTSSSKLKYSADLLDKTHSFPLGKAAWEVIGAVGGFPVWVHYDAELFLRVTVRGEVSIDVKTIQSGRSISGVTQTSPSDMTPKHYASNANTTQSVTKVTAEGSVTSTLGVSGQISLYNFGGPFAELGAEVKGTYSLSGGGGRSCSWQWGPYVEFGLKTSDLIKKLTGSELKASTKVSSIVTTSNLCPVASDVPQITTTSLPDATVGKPYSATLKATGGTPPYVWSATGLPSGLALDPTTGTISGTPATVGNQAIAVNLDDLGDIMVKKRISIAVKEDSGYVTIPDAGLLSCIDAALGVPDGTRIAIGQAASLKVLKCGSSHSIRSVEGLENFTRISELDLTDHSIADISPISRMASLVKLNLDFAGSDLVTISRMTKLTSLSVSSSHISDISPLAKLTNLTYLDLSFNRINDISPLKSLTKMRNLSLHKDYDVADLSPLSGMTDLTELYLAGNRVSDITPLANLVNLTRLDLTYDEVTDISPLSSLYKMTYLDLGNNYYYATGTSDGNRIKDISLLARMVNLTHLDLGSNGGDNNEVVDISVLAGFSKLSYLALQNNKITDASPILPLVESGMLKSLSIRGNPVCDVNPDTYGCNTGW